MRLEQYFRETATGLRRNGVVAFAAISTAFIALFLFGLAWLIGRQFDLVIDAWTGNVQVAVYLSDPVQDDTVSRIQTKLSELPAVASIEYWDKDQTCSHFDELFEGQEAFQEGVDCEKSIPTSLRINLADPSQFDQIMASLGCEADATTDQIQCTEPGVRDVSDYRDLLERLSTITRVLSIVVYVIAFIMLVSAILLVANTLRMGMFARRKEIGIMRLVGATNWRIRMPFLIEGLVETMVGALVAIAFLFLVKVFGIDNLRGTVRFFPWVRNIDVLAVIPWILIAAVAVAVIAGTIGMRRFLDV
ncbi:MAG TPA: permease-like cell division protein FtsX [Actinomycetota bacterium]|jgi:cell division transport system permease protein|nr:permease-like cell division protein FtsX [Actinomycetota bacterium]